MVLSITDLMISVYMYALLLDSAVIHPSNLCIAMSVILCPTLYAAKVHLWYHITLILITNY